jgi:hypothetical protein
MAPSESSIAPERVPEAKADYWQAVIGALTPEKRDAAWRFYAERELGRAHEARDTLSGLVLLLEANGLFMERCARMLQESAAGAGGPRPPSSEAMAEGIRPLLERLEALERRLAPEAHPRVARVIRRRVLVALSLAVALLAAGAFLGARAWAKREVRQAKRAYRAGAQVVDALRAQGGELRAYPSSEPTGGALTWVIEVRPGQRKMVLVQILLSVCFCLARGFAILSGQDRGPNFRHGGYFSGHWFEVELLFLDFLC